MPAATYALRQRPRLADIAREAGVSVSTVSRVLANEPGISETVRRHVVRLASELGYRARTGGPAYGTFLALLTCDHATGGLGVFYEGILAGLREAVAGDGGRLETRLVFGDALTTPQIAHFIGEFDVAGLFLVGLDAPTEVVDDLAARGIVAVGVNAADPAMRLDGVAPANFYGAFNATAQVLAAGHRRVLHLTHAHRPTILARMRGFEAAIAATPGASGRILRIDRVAPTHVAAREALIAALAEDNATAVFCMNDMMAVGALEALTAMGRKVGEFGVIGFDDLPCASMTRPRIATIAVDREAIGREAQRLMRLRLEDPAAPARHLELGVRFVSGETLRVIAKTENLA